MDTNTELNNILENISTLRENVHLEFKQAATKLPKSFWETYSSFANTSGGFIILGVSDYLPHEFTGVTNPKSIVQEIFNTANNQDKVSQNILANDDVKIHTVNNKSVISVHIHELPINKKPVYLNNNPRLTYIRKNEGDFIATKEELYRLIRNADENIDAELLENYTIEDLDTQSVLEFKNIIQSRNLSKNYLEMDNLSFLIEMGVFQVDRKANRIPKLTLAGLLFLGKLSAIIQRLPHFHLDYVNKRGKDVNRWKDRVSTGDLNYPNLNLFQYYKIVLEKLKLTVDDTFELDEKSIRKSPIELIVALREALANMVIHADYLDSETNIKVVVDNFYYTFLNPGAMKISTEQFFVGGQSKPRNSTLVLYFRRMGACEREGSGGKEISTVIKKNNFRYPELTSTHKSTFLKLWTAALEDSYPEFSPQTRKILLFIRENPIVSRKEIQTGTQLSDHFIRKALDELLEKNYINRGGKGRATQYYWNPSKLEVLAAVDSYSKLMTSGKL
ncbi:MAG: putative DNA binding domain-containing protein [Acidaminococcaceae bacterium]|nr:putative DNA binding domain-containing protein [Acidaminococcaceae bacterium]